MAIELPTPADAMVDVLWSAHQLTELAKRHESLPPEMTSLLDELELNLRLYLLVDELEL